MAENEKITYLRRPEKIKLLPTEIWHNKFDFKKGIVLYFHIPFCQKKCLFCHFYSLPGKRDEEKDRYVNALLKEMELLNGLLPLGSLNIKAVAVGGGTPMSLSFSQLEALLKGIKSFFSSFRRGIEYTFEINPHDIADRKAFIEKLRLLKKYSVNRLSLGAQSFDDDVLRSNGSRHTADEIRDAFEILRGADFININIDLIAGLKRQTEDSWAKSLERSYSMKPEHITVFYITPGEDTPLIRMRKKKPNQFPHTREVFIRTKLAEAFLVKKGFVKNSGTNYARGKERVYLHEEYTFDGRCAVMGLGASAVSWMNGVAFRNVRDVAEYIYLIENKNNLPMDKDNIYFPVPWLLFQMAFSDRIDFNR